MENLDLLIKKFQEVKEELQKSDASLHSSVEGFMGGLKALPKGSAERGKFITAHMGHAPFVGALNAHPQGKQLHGMLMNHLNSPANAGPKAVGGTKVVAKSVDDELDDLLEKAYVSPWWKFGSSKKKAAPAKVEGPAKPTGIDKIKHVSQEKIQPTSIVSDDRKRAAAMGAPSNPTNAKPPKLTGLDRIKAESQRPITATTVRKDEDEKDEDKELKKGVMAQIAMRDGAPHPAMMSAAPKTKMPTPEQHAHRAAHYEAFQPKPAAPAKKLTGMDRIKALSSQPIAKDEDPLKQKTADKKHVNPGFSKTVNSSYGAAPNSEAGMAMSRDEKLTLNKGGQWNLSKEFDDGDKTVASPLHRPARLTGLDRVNAESQRPIKSINSPKKWAPGQEVTGKRIDLPKGDPNQRPEPSLSAAHEHHVALDPHPPFVGSPLTSIPKLKPAGEAKFHVNTNAPISTRSSTPADPGQVTPGAKMFHKDEGLSFNAAGHGPQAPHTAHTKTSSYTASPQPGGSVKLFHHPAGGGMSSVTHLSTHPTMEAAHAAANAHSAIKPMTKDEDADNCSRCKKKPCTCIKTEGVLVDKMDGDIGSGV